MARAHCDRAGDGAAAVERRLVEILYAIAHICAVLILIAWLCVIRDHEGVAGADCGEADHAHAEESLRAGLLAGRSSMSRVECVFF